MDPSNSCPYGCKLRYRKIPTKISYDIVKTESQGTQTDPVDDDKFETQETERQYLAYILNYVRETEAGTFYSDGTQVGQWAALQLAVEHAQARMDEQRELDEARAASRARARAAVAIEVPVVENRERPQNNILNRQLELHRPQPRPKEARPKDHEQPLCPNLVELLPQIDLVNIQIPVLDLAERQRIQDELVKAKRPKFELVINEQLPQELFEPEQQPEINEGQQQMEQ